jgi:hypothetical protein
MGMRKAVLLVSAMLAVLVLAMAGPVFRQVLSPRPVEAAPQSSRPVKVENGPGVDNGAIQNAINSARGKPVTILLEPGEPADPVKGTPSSNCYTISGPIILASGVTIDSASAPNRWCMERASIPRIEDPNQLRWFRVTGQAAHNVTLLNAYLDGRGPGNVSVSDQETFVDMGLLFNQAISDPQNASQYSKNLTLRHVTFNKFYGVCTFIRYVDGITFDDVVCNDPTKGGLVFSYGARNGSILNSAATLTGDDALAFTSGTDAGGALVTNFDVHKTHLTQEQDDQGCGTLCFRGATDIITTDSDVGAGSGVGSIRIRTSGDAARGLSSSNIEVSSTIIRPDDDENGVYVNDPGASDIRIVDNTPPPEGGLPPLPSIAYTPPKCGILLSARTPVSGVTISNNTFVPDDPNYNVCYETTNTPAGSSVSEG